MYHRLLSGVILLALLGCNLAGPANRPPGITSPDYLLIEAEVPFSYTATADDPDNDPVTFEFFGLPYWLTADNDSVTGTPSSYRDSTNFTIFASDPHGGHDKLQVTLEINPGPADTLRSLIAEIIQDISPDSLATSVLQLSGQLPGSHGGGDTLGDTVHRGQYLLQGPSLGQFLADVVVAAQGAGTGGD